jgi:putative effector of murein hydrolase
MGRPSQGTTVSALHVLAAIAFTAALYAFCSWVQRRTRIRVAHPLLLSVLAGGVLFSQLPAWWLDAYLDGSAPITWALGPATAALALPFYRRRHILWQTPVQVCGAVLAGTLTTVGVVWALGSSLGLPGTLLRAMSVKSVTLPVALGLADALDTAPGIITICVFTNGLLGSALGPTLLSWVRVKSPLARGLALGTLSHAIGTAWALEEGPLAGAAGVVALTLSAGLLAAGAVVFSLLAR